MSDQQTNDHLQAAQSLEPLTSDQLELKSLRENWSTILPDLQRAQELVAAGYIQCVAGDRLIPALIREIIQLRAERIPPPLNPSLGEAIVTSYGVMSDKLRQGLHRTEKALTQIRFEAYQASLETLIPTLVSKGRLEAYAVIQTILVPDIARRRQLLELLQSNETPTAAAKENMEKLTIEIETLLRINQTVIDIINGGLTADQAIERAAAERGKLCAPAPAGTSIN